MPHVRFRDVSFAYAAVDVIGAVSLDLHPGWTGVVGDNGGGKTTLLRLIAGDIPPSTGAVSIDPPDPVIHLCPQRVDAITPPVRALAESWTRRDSRLKARLGLDPDQLDRWPTLSAGERKRWQIGAALAAAPHVLLVDEPTNHLDADARDVVIAALARFDGVGVVVSHDRALLAALTDRTVRVHRGRVALYRGSYAGARDTWRADDRAVRQAHADARSQQRALTRRLADKRQARAQAEASKSTRKRMKSVRDSDARGALAKGAAAMGENKVGRQVTVLRRAVDRATARVDAIAKGGADGGLALARERGGAVFVDHEPAPVRYLAGVDGASITRGGRVILRDVRVAVGRGERIHVRGANGAGKTTLLEAVVAASRVPPGRLLYLPQTLPYDGDGGARQVMDELRTAPPDERGRVMQVAAALGLDPDRVLATSAPSPGELRKLWIARGLGLGAWGVVLDEPTNHLDLPSIERLEDALRAYPGAVVVASHDDAFAAAVTDRVWTVDAGRVVEPTSTSPGTSATSTSTSAGRPGDPAGTSPGGPAPTTAPGPGQGMSV